MTSDSIGSAFIMKCSVWLLIYNVLNAALVTSFIALMSASD